jgi:predicted transcriptional regulator
MSTTMTIRLDPGLKNRLEQLAKITDRSKSYLAAEAIREFIELNEWQLREIEQAVKEADSGEFASEQALKKVLRKWGVGGD